MKNIKYAISLALLAVAPTIYAQNIGTKAAPDVPTFQVTLNVTNNGGGLDSVFVKKTIKTTEDSLILSGSNSLKVVYGTKPSFRLKANNQYMLESFTVNGTKVESMDEKFNEVYKDVNSYAYTPAEGLKEKTDVVINWVAKPEVKLVITGTEQTVNESKAATITVKADETTISDLKYYSDAGCTAEAAETARKKAGTFYIPVKIAETASKKAVDRVVVMVVNNKTELVVGTENDAPKCETTLLQGQPLSAAVITGGKVTVKDHADHEIKGTWSWVNPNALVNSGAETEDANKYDAIFTPDSAAVYNTATAKIGVAAKPVKTVTVSQTAGGVVAIENASADNKYIGSITNGSATANPKITVTATPDAGYKFSKWAWTGTSKTDGTESEDVTKAENIEITADAVVSAVFVKATRTITITAPTTNDNTLKVLNGTQEVATNTAVPVGTTLTIVATPGEDQEVVKVGYTLTPKAKSTDSTDPTTEANSFIVSGAAGSSYTVAATFKAKPSTNFLVAVSDMTNGALKLKSGEADIAPNSSVEKNTYVSIIALTNRGYKLASLTANGVNIKEASGLTVTDETTIAAVFEKETYPVAVTAPTGVTISAESGSKPFETSLGNVTATETDPGNYRLINLLVNNKPVANGSEVIVSGPTNISAQVKKLAALSILNEPTTTVTYSGKAQEYAVKTAANLGGFSVKYLLDGTKETIPTGVGTYTVVITRPADDIYAAITEKAPITRTLVIEPGVPGIKSIPFADAATGSEVSGSATVAGTWTTTAPKSTKAAGGLRADGDLQTIWFVPSDPNLMVVSVTTPKDQTTANSLTASVTLPSVSNGSIVLMNGDVAVAAGQSVYKGQTLKIKLLPDAGYMLSSVTLNGAASTSVDGEYTLTLGSGTHPITASGDLFVGKTVLSALKDDSNNKEKTYTGSPIELNASELTLPSGFPKDKWVISYQKDGNTVTPTNVITNGGYEIYVSRPEDAQYKALDVSKVGTLTIKPANITKECITVPTATAITTGETLLASSLTGGSVVVNGISVPGTFSWNDNAKEVTVAGAYGITFTPTDQLNYGTQQIQTGLSSYVSLKDASSYVMTLKTVNDGVIKITNASGETIDQSAPSIKVAAGMKLFIQTAATGTKIEKIEVVPQTTVTTETTGDKQVWSFIAPAENFAVTVTFTKESSSEGGDTPSEGTAVTGITLNKSTLTLARLKSEKLIATVAPTGATKKDVKWTSTAPDIASVAADGTVKALKVGTATIIATTVDGGFTAMCQVTVDFATALEKILSESLVYGQKGQIVIEPAAPVDVMIVDLTGKIIYNSSINNVERIPAYSGVYVVRLSASGKATTIKVLVR